MVDYRILRDYAQSYLSDQPITLTERWQKVFQKCLYEVSHFQQVVDDEICGMAFFDFSFAFMLHSLHVIMLARARTVSNISASLFISLKRFYINLF